MGYLAVWKVLDEMIMEFRQKGLEIPSQVMNDLKSALTTIKIGEVDTSAGGTAPKIEGYLGSVESYLITEAQKKFEGKCVDEWLKRLNEAGYETCETCEDEDSEPRFVSGVPRDQKWLRVEPKDELTFERLTKFAVEAGLSKRAEDGHLLVYGKAGALKEFISKMTTFEGARKDRPPLSR